MITQRSLFMIVLLAAAVVYGMEDQSNTQPPVYGTEVTIKVTLQDRTWRSVPLSVMQRIKEVQDAYARGDFVYQTRQYDASHMSVATFQAIETYGEKIKTMAKALYDSKTIQEYDGTTMLEFLDKYEKSMWPTLANAAHHMGYQQLSNALLEQLVVLILNNKEAIQIDDLNQLESVLYDDFMRKARTIMREHGLLFNTALVPEHIKNLPKDRYLTDYKEDSFLGESGYNKSHGDLHKYTGNNSFSFIEANTSDSNTQFSGPLSMNADKTIAAVPLSTGSIRFFDIEGETYQDIPSHEAVTHVAFHPQNNNHIACVVSDQIHIFCLAEGNSLVDKLAPLTRSLQPSDENENAVFAKDASSAITSLCWSVNGQQLITIDGIKDEQGHCRIKYWNIPDTTASDCVQCTSSAHVYSLASESTITAIAECEHAGSPYLILGCEDGSVYIMDSFARNPHARIVRVHQFHGSGWRKSKVNIKSLGCDGENMYITVGNSGIYKLPLRCFFIAEPNCVQDLLHKTTEIRKISSATVTVLKTTVTFAAASVLLGLFNSHGWISDAVAS
jgi:hypothetical protein